MPAMELSAFNATSTSSMMQQLQMRMAQQNVDQAMQRARNLQTQASDAQIEADQAQAQARSLSSQAARAQSAASQAQTQLQSNQVLSQAGQQITAAVTQALPKPAPAVEPAIAAQPLPVTNTQGQTVGTVVNTTA